MNYYDICRKAMSAPQMEELIEIIKYLLPATIVIVVVFFLLKSYWKNEIRKREQEFHMAGKKIITPVRLQSYERMILFLERISPENIILRLSSPGMTAFDLQTAMIRSIRDEYEHNLSQQLYISDTAWELIKNAKEDTIKTINTVAARMKDDDDSSRLAEALFSEFAGKKKPAVRQAAEFLKKELSKSF
mgnify:CR=1 FL=1